MVYNINMGNAILGTALIKFRNKDGNIMKVGYVRVSDGRSQNTARQDALMESLGVEKVYIDKCSGRTTEREQLKAMLEFVREGDVLIVESYSRLARSTRDLLDIVDTLQRKGVQFISQKEQTDTNTPQGRLMVTLFSALSQFEIEVTKERQREGIIQAKLAEKYTGRQKKVVDPVLFADTYSRWKSGELTARAAQKNLGLGARTFYRRIAEHEGRA